MQINVYIITMLVAGVTAACLAIGTLRKRSAPGRLEFVILMLAVAVWGCTQAFEGAAVTYQTKLFWGVATYLGSQSSPVLLLLFALRYLRPGMKLPLWKLLLLWLIPAVSLLMAATNQHHHLLWPSVTLQVTWAGVSAIYAHGPWFWVEVVYSYTITLLAILTIVRSVIDLPSVYATHSRFLLAGMILPLGINALYAISPSTLSGLDLTPLAFAITCAFIMGALSRYPLFDLKPVARNVLLDNLTDITITLDDQNRIVDLNPAAERALDVSLRNAMGKSVDTFCRWPALLPAIQVAEQTHPVETISSETGSDRFYDVSVIPLHNHYDHFLGRLILLRDATMRQRIAETLRQRESILRTLSEASFDLLSASDIRESIPRALHRLGANLDVDCICVFEAHPHPGTGRTLATLHHHWVHEGCAARVDLSHSGTVPFEELFPRWLEQLSNGLSIYGHTRDRPQAERPALEAQGIRSILVVPITLHDRFWGFVDFAAIRAEHTWSDAERVVLGIAANTLGAAIEHRTLDEARLEIDRQLQDARRLESLGVMAAGIAHHYNNLMTAVIGNLDLALLDLPADSAAVASIKQASKATMATIALTRQVMAYSGKAQVAPRSVNVNDLVTQSFEMFNASLAPTTKLELQLRYDIPDILADPNQILQVFLNLIRNATDAIGTQPGTIVLRSGGQICTAEQLSASRLPDRPEPGPFVYFEVSDTGCGMNAETQRRLFDPFFTTKAMGHGLGMSMVSGIVQTHKGAILLQSEVDRGTTVRLLFPERNSQTTSPHRAP